MMFVQATGMHNTLPEDRQPDLAHELKQLTGKVYRRTDHFIQLAILGAHKAAEQRYKKDEHDKRALAEKTAIYLTSGQGNISVFDRICQQRRAENLLPKPVDFINLLSNSAGFYVAAHLGLTGKNLFVTHHRFPVQMALLAAQNDLRLGRQDAVLLGGVDEWIPRQELAGKLLGVSPETQLGEGSNWLLLSENENGAIATLEVFPEPLAPPLLANLLAYAKPGTFLAFSRRFLAEDIAGFMKKYRQCSRFAYEEQCGYYETQPLFAVNSFLEQKKGRMIHIDTNAEQYMVITVANEDI